jgi:uncharacterized protein (DUF433 family)
VRSFHSAVPSPNALATFIARAYDWIFEVFMLKSAHVPQLSNIQPVDPALLKGDRIQPGHPLFGLVWINPERLSGTPCFYGTRVSLKSLFDSLAAGESLEDFLDGFEGVSREQALAVLELAGDDLLSDLERI